MVSWELQREGFFVGFDIIVLISYWRGLNGQILKILNTLSCIDTGTHSFEVQ